MDVMYRKSNHSGQNYSLTILFILVFFLIYGFQLAIFQRYSEELFIQIFTMNSVQSPTIGWVLATFSHGSLIHLIVNSALFFITGALSEPHMKRSEFVLFFLIAGISTTILTIAIQPEYGPMNGASGAVFGFMGYSMYHYAQQHPDQLFPEDAASSGFPRREFELLRSTYVVIGFPAVAILLLATVLNIYDTGAVADESHFLGFFFGIVYVYLQAS